MLNHKKQTIAILTLLGLFFGSTVLAVGIGAKPKKLDLEIKTGALSNAEILITNVSDQPGVYQVKPDSLEKNIKLTPADFQLNPGQSQLVNLEINFNRPGKFATNLSIVATPLQAGGLVAGTGVKIPVDISVSGVPIWWVIIGIAILILLFILARKKQEVI